METKATATTTRREFIQAGAATTGAALAASLLPQVAHAEEQAKPNLLFIYTEGQRSDALSIAGNQLLQTPNMDRIGREGAYFKNGFCTNALCAPARAAVLTGMYSHLTGALANTDARLPFPADIPIFTDLLREAGYEVAIVGKVHVRNGVRDRKWDYYFGFNAPMTNYYKPHFSEGWNGEIGEERVYDGYADDLVTEKALAWMNKKRTKPFCLLVWYQTPHAPFYRARRHLDLYNGIEIPKPSTFDDDLKGYPGKPAFKETDNKIGTVDNINATRSVEEVVKDYYAGLVALDENIGRMFEWLEKNKKLDDTAIIFSSDHGFFLGEWRLYDKRFMHEPSIRIPMMIRYPKRVKPGMVSDEMVLDLDIAPTILDIAGVTIPERISGTSMLKLTKGKSTDWRKEWLYHYYEYPRPSFVQPHYGIRTERYKLIFYHELKAYELYDLQQDPHELNNLADKPETKHIQDELWRRLAELRRNLGDTKSPATA